MTLEGILNAVTGFLWGPPIMILIFATGLYFSIATGFFQFRKLGLIFQQTLGRLRFSSGEEGAMTPFQAAATGIGAVVGAGNMAGVAVAITLGGPGAVFWMWMTALLGMIVKMAEVAIGVHFRKKVGNTVYGGAMHFIPAGLGENWRWLGTLYAVSLFLGALMTSVLVQPHTMGVALNTMFGIPQLLTAAVAVLLTAVSIIGGFQGIGRVTELLTPFMGLVYILAGLIVLIMNAAHVPEAFGLIFRYALSPAPAMGGFAGSAVAFSIRQGIARGLFSNEAGLGTAALIHSTARTDHPVRQAMWGAFEVFFDTIVVCTMTALVLLSTGVWNSGLTGIELTMSAFESSLGSVGRYIVGIGVATFVLSTMIGYYVCFETAVVHLFGTKAIPWMKVVYLVPALLFSTRPVEVIWMFTDVFVGILTIPNLFGILLLSGVFIKTLLPDFMANMETGNFRYPAKLDSLK